MNEKMEEDEGKGQTSPGLNYSHLTINVLELQQQQLQQGEEEEDGEYDSDDPSPMSPLDSASNRTLEEDDYFGSVPRLVIYGDYSAKSDHSLDFHIVCPIQPQSVLLTMIRRKKQTLSFSSSSYYRI